MWLCRFPFPTHRRRYNLLVDCLVEAGAMGRPCVGALLACAAVAASCCGCFQFQGAAAAATPSFGDNFDITGAEDHVKTSPDGQTWYLSLDNKTG
uniref:Uncharacterized protein n=1 Tax=Aegilops tauschii subsp. strangulata TaxID=200361 RepID=A0A453BD84_AEGTS